MVCGRRAQMVREGLTGEVTVLMFGQTSAGKSYTMDAIRVAIAEELGGHAAAGIFDDGRCQLQCFELHGDHVADLMGGPNAGCALKRGPGALLQDMRRLQLAVKRSGMPAAASNDTRLAGALQCAAWRWRSMRCRSRPVLRTDASGQVHVCNISSVDLASPSDLLRALEQATSRRQTHETTRNDASSRSHAFYWIRFSLSARPDGKLTLIDLAGSERSLDSMYHAAEQRKQGAQINASLVRARLASKRPGDVHRGAAQLGFAQNGSGGGRRQPATLGVLLSVRTCATPVPRAPAVSAGHARRRRSRSASASAARAGVCRRAKAS